MLFVIKGTVYAALNMNDADDAAQEFMACICDAFGDVKPDFGPIQIQAVTDRSLFKKVELEEDVQADED